MAEDQDDSQKTEDPSQRRLDDALKKGQVPNSREVTSFMILLVFAISIVWFSPSIMQKTAFNITKYIESPEDFRMDSNSIMIVFKELSKDVLFAMTIPISITIFMIFLSHLIQHPFVFSPEAATPKLDRISILSGFKRIFSMRSVIELIKGCLKIILVAVVSFIAIRNDLYMLENLPEESISGILLFLAHLISKMMIGICALMGSVAAFDFLYQKFEHMKSLRMSKQDLKEEYKQTEGSPEVKAKLREIRNARASNRMMQKVPKADVVITNPTHYSVALQYDSKISEAPIVVAKGKDLIALKIREIATENKVPIVENPPLARALYSSVELDQEIPLDHYNAVAEVIRYVYKLKGKKMKAKVN